MVAKSKKRTSVKIKRAVKGHHNTCRSKYNPDECDCGYVPTVAEAREKMRGKVTSPPCRAYVGDKGPEMVLPPFKKAMPDKNKWRALELTALAIVVVIGAVLASVHYEQQLSRINWRLVGLLVGASGVVFAIYHWQARGDNSYDLIDMAMTDGKADLDKHLTICSFGLAVWLVVQQALEKQPVTELMLGILGFFVLKRASKGFSDAMLNRPAAPAAQSSVNVLQGAQVAPDLDPDQMKKAGPPQ